MHEEVIGGVRFVIRLTSNVIRNSIYMYAILSAKTQKFTMHITYDIEFAKNIQIQYETLGLKNYTSCQIIMMLQ